MCGGLYNPTKEVLKSIREQIMLEPDAFHKAVQSCGKGFALNWDNALKRFPTGFSADDKHSEYYRLKSFEITQFVTKKDVLGKDYLPNALAQLKKCHEFNELLNKCADFVR